MYKGILILGVTVLLFVLGTNYLLVSAVQQKAMRERDRQDNVYWRAYERIEQFGAHPDNLSEDKAKAALDEARKAGLSKNRESILANYFQSLKNCYEGGREACEKANTDMKEAISNPYAKPARLAH